MSEGSVKWKLADGPEWETWYRTFGDIHRGKVPLVILHGGPGACHEYLLSLKSLHSSHDIPIIFYDQIGNGRSTRLRDRKGDEAFWTIALFQTELENLLNHLGLGPNREFDLLGHSWGAMLGSEFAALRPAGLRRLILASGPASMECWLEGVNMLRAQLPQDVQDVLDEGERTGGFQSPEYKAATEVFYRRHCCRLEPWPPKEIEVVLDHLKDDPTVYETMYGISELVVTGNLREWSVVDKLTQIEAPTLLINGVYDEAQDVSMQPFFDHINRVRWISLDGCSHFAHIEKPDQYVNIVANFLI